MELAIGLCVVVVAMIAIVAFFLEKKVNVKLEREFDVESEWLINQFKNPRELAEWIPLITKDEKVKIEFKENNRGVEDEIRWIGNHKTVGKGTVKVINPKDNSVDLQVSIGRMKPAVQKIEVIELKNSRKLIWCFEFDLSKQLTDRYHGLFLKKWMHLELTNGLNALEERSRNI